MVDILFFSVGIVVIKKQNGMKNLIRMMEYRKKTMLTQCDMCGGTGNHCCGCMQCFVEHGRDRDLHVDICPTCSGTGKTKFIVISPSEDDGI